MRKICLFFLFLCSFSLRLFAAEPPVPLVVDSAQIAWVKGEYEDEYTRTVMVGFKTVESITSVEISQLDEGFTVPHIFTLPASAMNYFKAVVDKEYNTLFTITAYNDSGYSITEFVLHPKDVTKTITLGVGEVVMPKDDAATVYSVGGRIVWCGSSSEVEQALRGLPRGIYIVKSGRTTKKVSVKP